MHLIRLHAVAIILTISLARLAVGEDAASVLRVATFNIYWANDDFAATAALIKEANADVVCLQETSAASEAYFRKALKEQYAAMHFHGDQGKYGAERFGLLSKERLESIEFLRPRHGLFGAQVASLNVGGSSVQILNVHLHPVILSGEEGLAESLRTFLRTENVHRLEIDYLLKRASRGMPTVVAGDFNSISSSIATTRLTELGYEDSFAAVQEKPDEHPTWRFSLPTQTLLVRIDYIFCSQHFTTIESRIIKGGASDHNLVVSEFSLTQPPSP